MSAAPLLSFLLLFLSYLSPTSTAASFIPPSIIAATCQGRADWKETLEGHVISIDVPGMNRKELKIDVDENRVLRVSGERTLAAVARKGERWHKSERPLGMFAAEFSIPENANLDRVEAKLEDGVLTLTISKLADRIVRPRTVDIYPRRDSKYKGKAEL